MYTALVLYNCTYKDNEFFLDLGERLFKLLNLNIKSVGYYEFQVDGNLKLIETDLISFKNNILKNYKSKFSLSSGDWCSFFQFNRINDRKGNLEIILDFQLSFDNKVEIINFIAGKVNFKYGISFCLKKPFEILNYFEGNNFTTIYENEDCGVWGLELKKMADKENIVLRMVYETNILNDEYFQIKIDDINLKQWILSDSRNGEIEEIENKKWLWQVSSEQLIRVNDELGKLGVLLAWKEKYVKGKKKIP